MDLYPYQREGVDFLKSRKTALLADEMRLGKTVQAITAAAEIGAHDICVVCPASVRSVWKREFERAWPEWAIPRPMTFVESYEKVTRGAFARVAHFDVLILDEAHYLKSRKAKRTKAILGKGGLAEKADRVWCLTGTPMPNNPSELYPMVSALFPDVLDINGRRADYWRFVGRYCSGRDNGFGYQITGGKRLDELKAKLQPHYLRRRQADVWADLPPMRYETVALEAKNIPKLDDEVIAEVMTAIERGAEPPVEHVATYRRLIGEAKAPCIAELLEEEFGNGLEKIVIFAHHKRVIEQLVLRLPTTTQGSCVLTGDTTPKMREYVVDRFNKGDERIFIGQLQAAGTGIALHAANDILFAEYSWVPAENQQAAMRCQHPEKKRSTFVRFVSLAGSIDEAITEAVRRKTATIGQVFA